jgi:type I restriction-modification system DNA methylase subunit
MKKENQHTINQRIEQFIRERDFNNKPYSAEDLAFIDQYEGSGGQGSKGAKGEGLLYEFYTPDYIAELMWELAYHYGYDGGSVLEPSIATGRLIKPAKDYSRCVGFEINPISARIAELLYPGLTVQQGYFETAFMQFPRFTSRIKSGLTWLKEYPFSLVIGNPPFGKYRNLYSSYFRHPKIPQIEMFFIYYGLQLLKPGGLLVYLISSNFLRNGNTYNSVKTLLEPICDLIDAYRLPPVFRSSDVSTDIIVLKRK